jgi:hypothetical protein
MPKTHGAGRHRAPSEYAPHTRTDRHNVSVCVCVCVRVCALAQLSVGVRIGALSTDGRQARDFARNYYVGSFLNSPTRYAPPGPCL